MNKQHAKLTIHPTKRPHTFFLRYRYDYGSIHIENMTNYKRRAESLVQEINEAGIKANLKSRYKQYSHFYITFRSKYDAAAFKLGWM